MSRLVRWLPPYVLELTYTAWDVQPFALDCGYKGPPFVWDEERRFLLRCELDAAYFHLYGIQREDVDYIMDTFPIVRRKDEERFGEYRTKRVILEIYDAVQQAIQTGVPYQTRLDPPPANGWTPPADLDQSAVNTISPEPSKDDLVGEGASSSGKARTTAPEAVYTAAAALSKDAESARAEELVLVSPPSPAPSEQQALDLDSGEMPIDWSERVRVNGKMGMLLAETPTGDGRMIVMVQFDGEDRPRKFYAPPAVIEYLAQ